MGCLAPCPGVEVLDECAFIEQASPWDELLRQSFDNRLFYNAEWQRIWWRHFGGGHPHVLTLRDDRGDLEGVLPLQVDTCDGRRVLSLIGDPNVTDYMDCLAIKGRAPELLRVLWKCALTELGWDTVELRHVPSSSPSLSALEMVTGELGLALNVEDDTVCPVAILCSTWEGYLEMLSKKQRHEIRRKLRRAKEDASWEWRTVTRADDLERELSVFFRLHQASAHDKASFLTAEMRDYFRTLAGEQLAAGRLRLSIFSREQVDLAASLAFVYRDRYLLYNSGYDPAYAAYSPGIAAVAHAMQDAINEKAVAFDFLSGDEAYKYQFGATNTYTARVTIRRQ